MGAYATAITTNRGIRFGLALALAGCIAAICAIAAPRASAASLTFKECFNDAARVCQRAPLSFTQDLAVSPDGRNVYVAAEADAAVNVFARDTSGTISFAQCVAKTNAEGCEVPTPAELGAVQDVVVSPNGRFVYAGAASDGTLTEFTRDQSTGRLTFLACAEDPANTTTCSDLPAGVAMRPESVAVSPGGDSVYVASLIHSSLIHFRVDPVTGAMTYDECTKDDEQPGFPGCGTGPTAMEEVDDVAVSADGKNLYVTAVGDDAITTFNRAANGKLTQAGCISNTGGSGCTQAPKAALDGAIALGLSADDRSLYVAAQDSSAVSQFSRDPATGQLAFQDCYASGASAAGCQLVSQTAKVTSGARDVEVSADGTVAYVAAGGSAAVTALGRDPATGNLSFAGCVASGADGPCTLAGGDPGVAAALVGLHSLAVSPDSQDLYTTAFSDASLVHFGPGIPGSGGTPTGPVIHDPNLLPPGSTLGADQILPGSPESFCKGKAATVLGSNGNDVLAGRQTADVVVAGAGKDKIKSLGGNDLVCAGAGNDTADGGKGKDRVRGDDGNDKIKGGKGNDKLVGGTGQDKCAGSGGKDKANGTCEKRASVP